MNDTEKEQKTTPAEEAAANNNVEESAEERAAADVQELSPEARVAALEAELAEQKDHLLRALAETENVRRRSRLLGVVVRRCLLFSRHCLLLPSGIVHR